MKIRKARWASLALIPATIIPLSTATSCSQAWGFKTPISIGTSVKGSTLDPYSKFDDYGSLSIVDLDMEPILPQLQSNYAVDIRSNNMYGYSLPQKWNENAVYGPEDPDLVTWEKGNFEEGNAAWYDYSSSDFVKSATRSGERKADKVKVSESVYSYRNNTLASNIQLIGVVGTNISSMLNYALQYQATQIGTQFASSQETDTNLATSWGGNITHGDIAEETNRKFYESIFASNAVSGTGKYNAVLHPTHVEFTFNPNTFPIAAYTTNYSGKIARVHDKTLALLNGAADRPSAISSNQHWSSVTDSQEEIVTDIRTGNKVTNTYKVYTYTNVPVVIDFSSLTRAYVNPTKNDSFIVSDYYAETKNITDTIGDSWKETLPKFATYSAEAKPTYRAYTYSATASTPKAIDFNTTSGFDERVQYASQNSFIVLLNFAYKEYSKTTDPNVNVESLDRVTMTGLNTVFPAYLLDQSVKLDGTKFFKQASEGTSKGYVIDSDKVSKYNNLLLELLKRSAGQGLITEANNLNDTSKQLLKLLSFVFGDSNLNVNTGNIINTYELK